MTMSALEQKFYKVWRRVANDIPIELEFKDERIRGKRNCLRFDVHVVGTNVLIELNGTSWHGSAAKQTSDARKRNLAIYCGYICFTLTPSLCTIANIEEIAKYVRDNYPRYQSTAD